MSQPTDAEDAADSGWLEVAKLYLMGRVSWIVAVVAVIRTQVQPYNTVARFSALYSCSAAHCAVLLSAQAEGDGVEDFEQMAELSAPRVRDSVMSLVANPGCCPELSAVLLAKPDPNCVYAAAVARYKMLSSILHQYLQTLDSTADDEKVRELKAQRCWNLDVRRLAFDWGMGIDSCVLYDWTQVIKMLTAGEAQLISLTTACSITATYVEKKFDPEAPFDLEQIAQELAEHAIKTRVAILNAAGVDQDVSNMLWLNLPKYIRYTGRMLLDATDCEGAPLARKTWFVVQVRGGERTYPQADVSPLPDGYTELETADRRQLLGGHGEIDERAVALAATHATLEIVRHLA